MTNDPIPAGLVPTGSSPIFSQDSIPEALQREHALAKNRWGILHVLTGRVEFEDLATGAVKKVRAPDLITIRPRAPHRLLVRFPVTCRIDFFVEPDTET